MYDLNEVVVELKGVPYDTNQIREALFKTSLEDNNPAGPQPDDGLADNLKGIQAAIHLVERGDAKELVVATDTAGKVRIRRDTFILNRQNLEQALKAYPVSVPPERRGMEIRVHKGGACSLGRISNELQASTVAAITLNCRASGPVWQFLRFKTGARYSLPLDDTKNLDDLTNAFETFMSRKQTP